MAARRSRKKASWYSMQLPLQYNRVIFSNGQEGIQTPELIIHETAWYDGAQWHKQEPDDVGSFPLRDADGNQYETVIMGNQVWMTENLKSTHYANGEAIPQTSMYENDTTYGQAYGNLYSWHAAINGTYGNNKNPSMIQGVCPEGWHVPSQAEWEELMVTLGGIQVAGGSMKSTRTAPVDHPRWESPNSDATNRSGFYALPGGIYIAPDYYSPATYENLGYTGYWWTATEYYSSRAHYVEATYDNQAIDAGDRNAEDYLSVRCIKD